MSAASVISRTCPLKADVIDVRQCKLEQLLLNTEAHETVRHIQADQSGMERLALHQGREVRPVVGHQGISVIDSAPDQSPILTGPEPEPSHMRRFRKSALAGYGRKAGAQTFVDEELQRGAGKSPRAVSLVAVGLRTRQKGSRRGRPRRGYARA